MRDEKLRRFMQDVAMHTAVYDLLLETFTTSTKDKDVHTLAAERIAINLLQKSWKELEKFKVTKKEEKLSNQGYV